MKTDRDGDVGTSNNAQNCTFGLLSDAAIYFSYWECPSVQQLDIVEMLNAIKLNLFKTPPYAIRNYHFH